MTKLYSRNKGTHKTVPTQSKSSQGRFWDGKVLRIEVIVYPVCSCENNFHSRSSLNLGSKQIHIAEWNTGESLMFCHRKLTLFFPKVYTQRCKTKSAIPQV